MPPKNDPAAIANQMENLTKLFSDALTDKQKHIDLPAWDNDIDVWFTRIENTFRLYNSSISSEQKAALIINKLPSPIIRELAPELDSIYSAQDAYGEVKKCLYNISGRTNIQRIRATYQLTQDPTKNPRQLLAELQQRWGYSTEIRDDHKHIFVMCLPENLRTFASSLIESHNITAMAKKCQEQFELLKNHDTPTNNGPNQQNQEVQQLRQELQRLQLQSTVNATYHQSNSTPQFRRARPEYAQNSRGRTPPPRRFRPPNTWCNNHKTYKFECRNCQRTSIDDPSRCHFPNHNSRSLTSRSPTPGNAEGRY